MMNKEAFDIDPIKKKLFQAWGVVRPVEKISDDEYWLYP